MSAVLEAGEPSADYLLEARPRLMQHFNLLAGAPGGIRQLRELILLLAVTGKLVPQDPTDEPASALVGRLQRRRDQDAASIRPKARRPSVTTEVAHAPFDLPESWEWIHLRSVVNVTNGRAYSKQELLEAGPIPVLRVGNLFTSNHWYYSDLELEPAKYCEAGDLLYAWSASFGPFIWDGPRSIFHYHIWKLEPVLPEEFDVNYFYLFLLEKTAEIKAAGHGVSMAHMTKEKMERLLVPYPPLEEQARIVARVDELMRLCDALQAKGRLEAEQHARLLSTLLSTLTDSTTHEELAINWQRVAVHFDLLLDRPEGVDALEQAIMHLAVRGALVPQEERDEPAAKLLERIRSDTAVPARVGKKRRNSAADAELDVENSFSLPPSWEWVRFNELVDPEKPISYGVLVPGPDVAHGVPFVRIADLSLCDPPAKPEKAIHPEVDAQYPRTRLEGGEILMGVVGSIGKLGVAPASWAGANIARAVCRIVPSRHIDREFVLLLLQSEFMQSKFSGDTRTLAQPTLNVGLIRNAATPLAPVAEQRRIVVRVNQLRDLCADLRQRLAASQATQSHLADALIESALA